MKEVALVEYFISEFDSGDSYSYAQKIFDGTGLYTDWTKVSDEDYLTLQNFIKQNTYINSRRFYLLVKTEPQELKTTLDFALEEQRKREEKARIAKEKRDRANKKKEKTIAEKQKARDLKKLEELQKKYLKDSK